MPSQEQPRRGVVYVAKSTNRKLGLVKIGFDKSIEAFRSRKNHLRDHGYHTLSLEVTLAIETESPREKEALLHKVFGPLQAGKTEIFSVDKEVVEELLRALKGKIIYPEPEPTGKDPALSLKEPAQTKGYQGGKRPIFNFYELGLKDGDLITLVSDKRITAKVAGSRDIEYQGQRDKIYPTTARIINQPAGKGFDHRRKWGFKGRTLYELYNQRHGAWRPRK